MVPSSDLDDSSKPLPTSINPLAAPPRTHPPPLVYLPVILTPVQSAFIDKRKTEVRAAHLNDHMIPLIIDNSFYR